MSDAHLAARRAQILAGARRAFARHGYEGATVARLEEEIGLSRGAIFNYFASKDDLFVELALGENRRFIALAVERGVDEAIREMARESPDWLAVLLEGHDRARTDPSLAEKLVPDDSDQERFLEWTRAQQAAGAFRGDVDALNLARFMTIVLNGLALRVVAGEPVEVESVLRLLHGGLEPRE